MPPTGRSGTDPTIYANACSTLPVSSPGWRSFLRTQGPIAVELSTQLLKSGTSAGANYEEADDGSSPKDVRAKRKIVLRELKETSFRLRVLRNTGILTPAHDPVITECTELVKIVATLIQGS